MKFSENKKMVFLFFITKIEVLKVKDWLKNVTTYYISYNEEGKLIEKYDGNKIIYYEKDITNNMQN